MATKYGIFSPWYATKINQNYLEEWAMRSIPIDDSDADYVIQSQYKHRPDLVAFDAYGDSKLWWVIVQRNMDIIKDPIYDFEPGLTIKIPRKETVLIALGLS